MTEVQLTLLSGKPGFLGVHQVIGVQGSETLLYVSAWRPGRYEESNYSRNIRSLSVCDDQGNAVLFTRHSKNAWKVTHGNTTSLHIHFEYFAQELNAGSSYVSQDLIYVNPVNCILFTDLCKNEGYSVLLQKPAGMAYAGDPTFLKEEESEKLLLEFPDFDALADSPFYCCRDLKSLRYTSGSTEFFIHFTGLDALPDGNTLVQDFSRFTEACIQVFGDIPVRKYCFLFLITDVPFYHGVEHLRSTVIVLGPGSQLFNRELYEELLGISCHELFHVWNIKTLRPAVMQPYDFRVPVLSDAGLIYEGITTYYGDWLLYVCGLYSEQEYLHHLGKQLQKHVDNPGRFNHTVTGSSLETWVDGYVKGTPGRKVSIYVEGCLLAFIADCRLRTLSSNKVSLNDAMRIMYQRFGAGSKGYDLTDYRSILEELSGESWEDYFTGLVFRPGSLEVPFLQALQSRNWTIRENPLVDFYQTFVGCKTEPHANGWHVSEICEHSPAAFAGVLPGDVVCSVNGIEARDVPSNPAQGAILQVVVLRAGRYKTLEVHPREDRYFKQVSVVRC
jgi:predicted metalloprotease with PDZ domain